MPNTELATITATIVGLPSLSPVERALVARDLAARVSAVLAAVGDEAVVEVVEQAGSQAAGGELLGVGRQAVTKAVGREAARVSPLLAG